MFAIGGEAIGKVCVSGCQHSDGKQSGVDRTGFAYGEGRDRYAARQLTRVAKDSFSRSGLAQEGSMDTTTLLLIIIIVLLVGGGGWYGRGRWF